MNEQPDSSGEGSDRAPRKRVDGAGEAPRKHVDRARLERIFGEVLPRTSADERSRDGARADDPSTGSGDAWLRRNVPPHHG